MSHSQLGFEDRCLLCALKKAGKSIAEIAIALGRHISSIYRELRRNKGGRGYRPKQAQSMAETRSQTAGQACRLDPEVIKMVEEKLRLNWSPEQIVGRLKKEEGIKISHESIYQHVLADKKNGGDLYRHLRCQKKNRKRYGTKRYDKRGKIKNRVSIEERPNIVEKKTRLGDWEGDLVIGKNHIGALVTLTDRKSKRVKIGIVPSKEAAVVSEVICQLLKDEKVFTITFDNGKEFANHEYIAQKTGSKVYFAHPYSSWERGLNENTNGLIRQYFPKGSSFEWITEEDVILVEAALNSRPRKTLGYNTPDEISSGERRYCA